MQQFDALGFDFVAITDHNNTTHAASCRRIAPRSARPLWIIGEEVTTPAATRASGGSTTASGSTSASAPAIRGITDLVAAARRYGALFSVNHPASTCLGCGWEHDGRRRTSTAIEISNGRHGEVDAGAGAAGTRCSRRGRRITGVGSSDWHAAPESDRRRQRARLRQASRRDRRSSTRIAAAASSS